MNNLSAFTFENQEVRFVGTADEPEWVAADIVAILYPSASRSSYSKYLGKVPPEWKGKKQILTPGGKQKLTTLFEPGLYCLIGRSDSSLVVPFQRWLYEEVIPSIRKTGSYSLKQETPPSTPVLPSAKERLETICMGIDLLERLGGCDQRTELQLKDQVRNILLAEKLQPSSTEITTTQVRLEYPVSDRSVSLGYRPNNRQLQQIGKQASRLYQERHGTKPIQREQFVGGATRMVNVYGFNDLDLLDQAILSVMDK